MQKEKKDQEQLLDFCFQKQNGLINVQRNEKQRKEKLFANNFFISEVMPVLRRQWNQDRHVSRS